LPIKDLDQLINSMEPVLNPGVFAFVSVQNEDELGSVMVAASIHEPEGYSAIVAESDAIALGLPVLFRAAWITLTVDSDLQAVGLTAAFANALGKAGISCNVVAGAYHDHIFVPVERANDAMKALKALQTASKKNS
jgi:uncharacterized protein